MKGKLLKKVIASVSAVSMLAPMAFALPASAADEQTVDLSKFTTNSTYDNGTASFNFQTGGKVTWSKLDLKPYTQKDDAHTSKVTISYKENITQTDGTRLGIGFYDDGVAKYESLSYENTSGCAVVYGVLGKNSKRVYFNPDNGTKSATFSTNTQEDVKLVIDFDSMTISGNIGPHTIASTSITTGIDSIDTMALYSWTNDTQYTISDMKITTEYSNDVYYGVTFNVEDEESKISVKQNETVPSDKIPEPSKLGYTFKGWHKDNDETTLYQKSDIESAEVTADTKYTAVFEKDASYVQKIATVEFTTGIPVLTVPDTDSVSQDITVKVTSENGVDLTNDCHYEWSIIGKEQDAQYTDFTTDDASTNSLSAREGTERSYFGHITVKATYTPDNKVSDDDISTGTAFIPYAIVLPTATTNFIPKAGYPVEFNDYADTIVGIKATETGNKNSDPIFGWAIYGSNGSRTITLKKGDGDDTDKYIEFAANGGGTSTVGLYHWTAQTNPYIVETVIKMPSDATFGLYNTTPNNSATVGWRLAMGSSALTVSDAAESSNNQTIAASPDTWYKVRVIADPVTKKYYAQLRNPDTDELIGESEQVTLGDVQTSLCTHSAGTVSMKSMRAYNPTLVGGTILGSATVKVPEAGEADVKTSYIVNFKDANGTVIPSKATWSLGESYNGVQIDANTGELTVSNGAGGNITIVATSGAARAEFNVLLTTSSNVVTISGNNSITIPFSGEPDVTATYTAKTIDSTGTDVTDDEITYSVLKKDGVTPYDTLPAGIEFDTKTATLTVKAGAVASIIYIQAQNKEGLTNKIMVNIHGMSFSFGTGEPDEGYSQVLATSQYSDASGYGFETLAGLTAAENNIGGSSDYKFNVKVPNGNYSVTVDTTSATMKSETYNGASISRNTKTFNVAVCDGILDVTFLKDSTVSSLQIAQIAQPTPGAKPSIYSIGDSTTSNSGHPKGYDPNSTSNDHRTYSSWGNCVTADMYDGTFASYSNHGMAGRNVANYYEQNRVENVLLSIAPGDYVTINMGINWVNGYDFEEFMDTYYVKAIIDRGAIPVILTHTPNGPGLDKGGTFDTSFHVTRSVTELRNIAEKYNLNIIEVDKYFEDYFNSLLEKDFDTEVYPLRNTENENGKLATYTPPTTVLGVVQTWFVDHNHYTKEMGTPIAKYIIGELIKIAEGDPNPPATEHTVTFTGENATVTVDGKTVTSTTVKEGDSVQFTVTAAEGYEIKEVKAGETVLDAVEGVYTLTDVKADTTVTITTEKVVVPESWIKYEATYENGVLKNVVITPNAEPTSVTNDETHKTFFWNDKMKPWTAE